MSVLNLQSMLDKNHANNKNHSLTHLNCFCYLLKQCQLNAKWKTNDICTVFCQFKNQDTNLWKCHYAPRTVFSLYKIYFILFWKLLAYRNNLESVPGTNQYWAMSVEFLAHGNNSLPLTGFEPVWTGILSLLVWCINHSTTSPPIFIETSFENLQLFT